MKRPEVSVVMSCYNEERHVSNAIHSIIDQSFSNFEFIIINDGSTDNTKHIIEELALTDNRITLIDNSSNIGLSAALNKGIRISKSPLIARMDADDIAYKDRLKKQFLFMKNNPDVDILGTGVEIETRDGPGKTRFCPEYHSEIIRRVFRKPLVFHPTVMIKKAVYEKCGYYNEALNWAEDADLWYRIYDQVRFHNLQEALLIYRVKEKLSFRQMRTNLFVKIRNMQKRNVLLQMTPQLSYDVINLMFKMLRYRF